jgi:NMD protein affecting ribosome stability and mRNA decay
MERQLREPNRQDPYRGDTKPPSNPFCATCHAVNVRGKWLPEKDAARELKKLKQSPGRSTHCPACRQMQEHYAMGVIELHGDRWKDKSEQVFETIEHTEQIARARNDQERVLWSRTFRGVTKIYVTLPELARMIGRTLQRAFKGKTEYVGSTEEPYIRVVWHSDLKSTENVVKSKRDLHRSRHWRGRGAR